MEIALIHNDKQIGTGAHFINDLLSEKLRNRGIEVKNFYPKFLLTDAPMHFKGINNILFFYSLLEKRDEVLKCDIIQGTTYTPLAFLKFSKPVVSHFGSTTIGFLNSVPKTRFLEPECKEIVSMLKQEGALKETDIKTRRPLNDIVDIEKYAAERADYIIATSEIVKKDLVNIGINPTKITVIYNAIEDYWFESVSKKITKNPRIVFLGRLGEDAFTLKLKGIDRIIWLFQNFPTIPKLSIVMSKSRPLISWLKNKIPNNMVLDNTQKDKIPSILKNVAGSIAILTSRYEGFSLSLIELMSQKLIPISFPVGVAPEIINNGKNGFIVNSLQEAKEKIDLLIKNSGLRKKMAEEAFKTAQRFNSDTMINKVIPLYKNIVRNSQHNHQYIIKGDQKYRIKWTKIFKRILKRED